MRESSFLSRIFSGTSKKGASVDALPLRCGKNSSFEVAARQHTERLQVQRILENTSIANLGVAEDIFDYMKGVLSDRSTAGESTITLPSSLLVLLFPVRVGKSSLCHETQISAIPQCRTHCSGALAPLLNKTTRPRGFASLP